MLSLASDYLIGLGLSFGPGHLAEVGEPFLIENACLFLTATPLRNMDILSCSHVHHF